MKFPTMFSPVQIGSVTVPNRFVVPPMGNNPANTDGSLSDRCRNRAGRLQGIAGECRASLGARMLELDGDLRAVGMTGRGHLAEALDGGIREQARLAGAALRLLILLDCVS